jgi:hypothetical protein
MSAVITDEEFARRAAELAGRAEAERPPAWIPEDASRGHPSTIAGVLVRYEQGHSAFGPRNIAVVREPSGAAWSVWMHGKVLQEEFAEQQPAPGELIAVSYLGRKRARNPQPGTKGEFEAFRLVVEREVVPRTSDVPREPASTSTPPPAAACEACGQLEPRHAADCPLDPPPF